jgi:hypothetical protein
MLLLHILFGFQVDLTPKRFHPTFLRLSCMFHIYIIAEIILKNQYLKRDRNKLFLFMKRSQKYVKEIPTIVLFRRRYSLVFIFESLDANMPFDSSFVFFNFHQHWYILQSSLNSTDYISSTCQSQWPRGLRHELSSLVRKLGS